MFEIIIAIFGALMLYGFMTMKVTWFRVVFFGVFGVWMYYMIQSGSIL